MIVGTRYNANILEEHYDAIVIGSGMGGLGAAAILSKAGKKVLVLERHYTAGGFTHSFKRKGYEWDTGLHYIGEVHNPNSPVRIAFDAITDGELQWENMGSVYERMFIAGDEYKYVAGKRGFKEELLKSFPHAGKEIDQYFKHITNAMNAFPLQFAQRFSPSFARSFVEKTLNKTTAGSYYTRTTKDVMSEFISDPKLISVLTAQWGDYGVPPERSSFGMHGAVASHYVGGGNFPVGGPSMIAHYVTKVIERAGGQVLVNAEVDEILIKNNRAVGVRTAEGDEILAKNVISAAGIYNTYCKMVPEHVGKRYALREKVGDFDVSSAHVGLYVGMKSSASDLGIEKANHWVYPDYDYDKALNDYQSKKTKEFPLTYLSFPSAKDPAWETHYPGRSTIDVIAPMPYEWFKKWENTPWKDRGQEYDDFKEEISEQLLETVYQQVPSVKGKVDYHELSTPLSTKHFNNYAQGELYGLDHTTDRFRQTWVKPNSPIKGLYLAGQDVLSCGVVPAMLSGIMTASMMLGPEAVKIIPEFFPAKIRANQKRNAKTPYRNTQAEQATKPFLAECVAVEEITHDVKAFRFKRQDGKKLRYRAGQFVTLEIEKAGEKIFRSYTMSSTPTRPDTFEVTVKRVEGGVVSNWLCDSLRVGASLKMIGAYGQFTCEPKPAKKLLFVSAGSGVTPMVSMSRSLLDKQADVDIQFLHFAKTPQDIIFKDEIARMDQTHSNITSHISLTRVKDKKVWSGLKGYLDKKMLEATIADYKERDVYICGPESFMDSVEALLEKQGFPMANFYKESFEVSSDLDAEGGTVFFSESKQEVQISGQQTVLDVAEQAGIKLESACRTGDCGECKARKVDGEIVTGNCDGLDPSEVEEGYVLTCVSAVNGKVTIAA